MYTRKNNRFDKLKKYIFFALGREILKISQFFSCLRCLAMCLSSGRDELVN